MKNDICKALGRVSILRCRNLQLCKIFGYGMFWSLFFFSTLVTQVLLFNLTHIFCKVQLEQIFSRIWKCRSSACCEIKSFEEKSITISLSLSLILYWRAACDILTASQIQKKRQSRPSRKICVFWSFKLLWLSLIFLGTCYHMPPPPNIFRFCGVEVPILFGNDLLWNSLPYSKGFVMSEPLWQSRLFNDLSKRLSHNAHRSCFVFFPFW